MTYEKALKLARGKPAMPEYLMARVRLMAEREMLEALLRSEVVGSRPAAVEVYGIGQKEGSSPATAHLSPEIAASLQPGLNRLTLWIVAKESDIDGQPPEVIRVQCCCLTTNEKTKLLYMAPTATRDNRGNAVVAVGVDEKDRGLFDPRIETGKV